jgi:hypothetical protein
MDLSQMLRSREYEFMLHLRCSNSVIVEGLNAEVASAVADGSINPFDCQDQA